jgi:TRAP-type C4-dicarboxylate transport system substrate-binding protein
VREAAANAEERGWAKAQELADWYKEQLADNGMTVQAPGEELAADLQEIGAQMTEEWLQRAGDLGTRVIEAYEAM